MERYQLQSDEAVLYKCGVIKVDKYKKESFMDSFSSHPTTELILTNKNIVLTTRTKKMFTKEQLNVEVLSLADIKINSVVGGVVNESMKDSFLYLSTLVTSPS